MFLAAGQLVAQVVQLLVPRFFTPADYGLVGMVNIVQGFLIVISDLGLAAALIQRKDLEDAHKDAAFWSNAGMGTALFLVFCALAPAIAWWNREPRVAPIVILSAVSLLLMPLWQTHAGLLRRELRFRAVASIELSRALATSVVAIGGAWMGFGYWAIVAGSIANHLAAVAGYSLADKTWRLGRRATRRHARELFSFSLYVAGGSAVNYLSANVDYLAVGRVLGAAALGAYTLAYQMMTFPLTRISSLFSQVMFPAFASIQDKLDEMREVYLKISRTLALISFPILAWMAVAAPEIVRILYGEHWHAAVPIVRILSVAGALKSVGTLVGIVYRSRGKAYAEFYWNVVWVILLCIGILIGIRFGTAGVAAAISGLCIPGVLFTQWLACRYLEMPFRRLLWVFVLPAVATALCAVAGLAIRSPLVSLLPDGTLTPPASSAAPGAFASFFALLSIALRLVGITVVMLAAYVAALRLLHPPIVSEAKAFLGYFRNKR